MHVTGDNPDHFDVGVQVEEQNQYKIQGNVVANQHDNPPYYYDRDGGSEVYNAQQPLAAQRCPPPSLYYTHREIIEKHMESYFGGKGRKCYVLSGPIGAGKTEIALAMMDKYYYSQDPGAERFSAVYWINARSVESIEESFKAIAFSTGAGSEVEDALRLLASRRGSDANWMVLFDGADDPNLDLKRYFPKCSHGNILITTRNYHCVRRYCMGKGSDHVVFAMTPDEALMLFNEHARLSDEASPETAEAAKTLVKELGHFALAISQVGDCISTSQRSPIQYLHLNRDQRQALLDRYEQKKTTNDYPYGSALIAWVSIYGGLSDEAKELLQMFVCLHAENLRQDFISNMCTSGLERFESKCGSLLTESEQAGLARLKKLQMSLLTDGEWDTERFLQLISELRSHSLIGFDPEHTTCNTHPLIQAWVNILGGREERAISRQSAILLLGCSVAGFDTARDRALCKALAPHIDQVFQGIDSKTSACSGCFGKVYWSIGRWDDAVVHQELYKELCIRQLGRGHRDTLASVTDLALTYQSQGRYDEAETLQLQMMRVQVWILGAEHPDTLTSTDNLASTYQRQEKYDEAERLHLQAMEARKQVLGAEHPDTLRSMFHLAVTYASQKKTNEAHALQLQAAGTWRKVFGECYPDTPALVEVDSREAPELVLPIALDEHSGQHAEACRALTGYVSKTKLTWHDLESPNGNTLTQVETGISCNAGEFALAYTSSWIFSVTFMPDGKHIVSGSDKTVQIWDAATGRCIKQLSGHANRVYSVAVSPDGKLIASGSRDNTIWIWNLETGASVGEPWKGHTDGINSVTFSPGGRHVVSGSNDKTVRIWDVATGCCIKQLSGHTSRVYSVAVSSDGKLIASGSLDKTIRIWDLETGASVGEPWKGNTDDVNSVAFSPDGKHIVSGADDKTVRIWDVATGRCIKKLSGHTNWVWSVVVSPDGKLIASGSRDSTLRIWDLETGASVGRPLTGHADSIRSIAFSSDGQYMVSGSEDKTIRRWRLSALGINPSNLHS